ncbi:hypothetical protein D3C76_1459780 [compost metagenome]
MLRVPYRQVGYAAGWGELDKARCFFISLAAVSIQYRPLHLLVDSVRADPIPAESNSGWDDEAVRNLVMAFRREHYPAPAVACCGQCILERLCIIMDAIAHSAKILHAAIGNHYILCCIICGIHFSLRIHSGTR